MSKFTLYRADIDSPRLARALDRVPGVAVESDLSGDRRGDETPGASDSDATPTVEKEGGGLSGKVPLLDTDGISGAQSSTVKTYGVLGLGVSLITVGVATVSVWVYRQQSGSESESETPPATGVETDRPTAPGSVATESPADKPVSVVGPDAESDPEPSGRTEGDRSDIEWTTRDTTREAAPETEESDACAAGEVATETDPHPAESVDAAPLLGAAFLAVTGAVVRWLQTDDQR